MIKRIDDTPAICYKMKYFLDNVVNMYCSSQGYTSAMLAKLLLVLGLLSLPCILEQPCLADAPLLPTVPKPVEWVSGPNKAPLGTVAEIDIPKGYRFTDATGARSFLERTRNPPPKNLIGLLTSDSEASWIVFEFAEVGYVQADNKDPLDEVDILKTLSSRGQSHRTEAPSLAPSANATW